jgi:hypothetical protein
LQNNKSLNRKLTYIGMNFYNQYSEMLPYKGTHFGEADVPSLLLIGESHYLPYASTQHLSAEHWYAGNSTTLTPEERKYIRTDEIVTKGRNEGFKNSIWFNSLPVINEYGFRFSDYNGVADYIAFYNFFLRPAYYGESLGVTPLDVEYANEAFALHLATLKPSAVIFISKLAYDRFRPPAGFSMPVIATPHPGSPWWNREAAKYGNKRGRDILADFIKAFTWPQRLTAK